MMSASAQTFPTLLLSRAEALKARPMALGLDGSIHDFPVKNTFIDFGLQSPTSFMANTRRTAKSCSPKRSDCLPRIATSADEEMEMLPCGLCSPCAIRTPTADTMSLCSWVESLDSLDDMSPVLSVVSDDLRSRHQEGEGSCHP